MPNQRSKNKIQLGGFMDKKFHAEITRMAKKEGMESNRFGFVQKLMREAIDARKKEAKRNKQK